MTIHNILRKTQKIKLLVAGDFFLDHYYYGNIKRISPEAPIPVLSVETEMNTPGGAGNVVSNLCRLGCDTIVLGIIGADHNGDILIEKLNSLGADTSNMKQIISCKTIVKARVIAGENHQIVRLDFNESESNVCTDLNIHRMENIFKQCDAAILSDYGKGFCQTEITKAFIEMCKRNHVPVFVDPKGTAWDKYRGADWITPNFTEFLKMIGKQIHNNDEDVAANIALISKQFGINNVLVTRSDQGMTLYRDGCISHIRAKTREVYDVSGAGDTVVAVLSAMIGAGADTMESVKTANMAAGIVVGKKGTATVSLTELESELRLTHLDQISAKIMDWDTLFSVVAHWRAEGKSIAVTNGCFDVFHKGHALSIQIAAGFCDKLIVAINTDETVRRLKGPERPINGEKDRAYVLAALEYVDAVVIFSQDTPEELLSHILPDVLVKGREYTIDQVPGRQYAKRVEFTDYIEGYSTTSIVSKIMEVNDGARL